jgi:hypothetical protein
MHMVNENGVMAYGLALNSLHSHILNWGACQHLGSYKILGASLQGLHSNDIFSWESQVGVSKLKLFLLWI